MIKYALCDRRLNIGAPLRGVSCDEDGVFLAGEVPLVMRSLDRRGKVLYQRRSTPEINFLFLSAYGPSTDFSDRIAQFSRAIHERGQMGFGEDRDGASSLA